MRATWADRIGIGVLEQLVIGPHAPSGFTDFIDGAPDDGIPLGPPWEAELAAALGVELGAVAFAGLTRLTGGASRETWRFDADATRAGAVATMGVASEAEFAAAIASGDLDDRDDDVREVLASGVAAKLAVANPRYLAQP